jgi:hypothetical protein
MADLLYELLSQAVKNTNITINLNTNPLTEEPKKNEDEHQSTTEVKMGSSSTSSCSQGGFVRADLIQLISDLESVSTTLKKINKSLVGHEHTDVFSMLQNFDKILNSVKMVVNAV